MQAQVVMHVGAGENMMNQMATFCLGERAYPLQPGETDQAQATKNLFCLIMYLLSDLWPL